MTNPWMVDVHTHLFPDWVQQNRWDYTGRDEVFKEIVVDPVAACDRNETVFVVLPGAAAGEPTVEQP